MCDPDCYVVDPGRSAELHDVGGSQEHFVAVTVGPDGDDLLLVVHRPALGDHNTTFNPDAPDHEWTGPLPAAWRQHRTKETP